MADTLESEVIEHAAPHTATQHPPLRTCVAYALSNYFKQVGNGKILELYDMVLSEMEVPLIEAVLRHTQGNQSQAALLMGISRGTLRKKMAQYDIA